MKKYIPPMGMLPTLGLVAAVIAAMLFTAFADDNFLPDHRMTPGVTDPALTKDVICAKGFSTKSVRNVINEAEIKTTVYDKYGMTDHKGLCALVKRGCEIDHLIPLEIGGKTDAKNLWPQPYGTKTWNANVKDRLENRLHRLVCSGDITLQRAQVDIATDWITAYKKYCLTAADCPAYKR
jgi:hypothetical protein